MLWLPLLLGSCFEGCGPEVSEKGSVGEPLCSEEPLHFGMSLLEVGMYLSCFGMILSCFDMVLRLHVGKWFAAGVFFFLLQLELCTKPSENRQDTASCWHVFWACCCACLPCLAVLSLQPQPLLERVVFTILATMAMGGQASAEEYSRSRGLGAEYRSTELTPLSGGSGERRSAEPSNPGFFATIRFWACSSERGSKAACSFESGCSGSFGSECACSFGSECACSFGSECACSFGSECACSFGSGCDCSFDSGCYGCSSGPCFSSGDGGFRFLGAAVARGWPILKEVQGFPRIPRQGIPSNVAAGGSSC